MSMLVFIALLFVPMALVFRVVFVDLPRSAVLQARNNLFALRAELFELARSGHIGFDSRAYQMRRSLLNGLIRYADDISFTHFYVTRFSQTKQSASAAQRLRRTLDRSLKNVNPNVANKLESIEKRAHTEMLLLMAGRSLLATMLFRAVWAIAVTRKLLRSAVRLCEAQWTERQQNLRRPALSAGVTRISKPGGLKSTETFNILRKKMSSQIDGSAWKYVTEERDIEALAA
ncbi:hypothetical protein HBF26_05035 [Luteibacter jiangsuensis]|uniref:Uncharacterized protein n=1 Tax=Luteibacter jiangsuensis TaxID=637577 RepID=A0ABX0Q143_9GAMM|nr:hypothetical protein [Luteibacter jiangsuensis]NID04239.1 hypothetical protein [Luteibacter jiangsuensis]